MVLHGDKQSIIKGIGEYSHILFDNMWSEHMLKVEKTQILSQSYGRIAYIWSIFQ